MNLLNQLDPRLGDWVFKNLKKVEIILSIVIAFGLIIKMLELKFGGILIVLSTSTLAVFYFWRSNTFFENIGPMERFFNKLLPFTWSISVIDILFLIQGWPSFGPMLIVNSVIQFVVLIALLFMKEKGSMEYKRVDKSLLLRSIIIASLAISLHFCPKEILIRYHIISQQQQISDRK